MIIDELNKKIADIESLANDKASTIESKVSDLTDGLLMVADAVDIIPEMVDEKITAITKEFSTIKDSVSKVKAQKGDKGDRGEPGIDGIGIKGDDGKDGSPDTGEQIASKLNELEGVLDTKVLKDFEMPDVKDLERQINTIGNQTLRLLSRPTTTTSSSFTGVTTDATLTGLGTDTSPLSVVATSASDVAVTVRAATTAALAGTWTYNNGTAGVGATLTRTTNGALPNQDGVSLSDGDRFLIKNQASTLANGVYVLTQKGVTSVSPTIFTRATDADETSELDELVVTISEGSTNRGTVWGQQTNNPVVGTSAIVFATVVSTAVTQATSGTQAINQIPLYTGTARQLTRGTANFKYNPTTDLFTIRGIDYTFPANNGDASQVLTTDGSGTLSWAAAGGGGSPAGSDTQIQYNNAGAFGADSSFQKSDTGFNVGLDHTAQSAVSFTGSGLDDLEILLNSFSGTYPTTYTVIVDGINKTIFKINTNTITGGSFSIGDTITSASKTAIILGISVNPYGNATYLTVNVTSGSFSNGNVLHNGSGVTAPINEVNIRDTFSINDGVTTLPYTVQYVQNGIAVVFNTPTGHTLSDEWTWTYSTVNQNVLDFSNNDYKFQSTFGTDTYGYQISDNFFGAGFKGSANIWRNIAGDLGFTGILNINQPQIIDQLTFADGYGTTQSLLKNQYDVGVSNGTQSSDIGMTATTFDIQSSLSSGQYGISQSAGAVSLGNLLGGNGTKITIDDVTQLVTISNVPAFDKEADAIAAGLTTGDVYQTTAADPYIGAPGFLKIVQ